MNEERKELRNMYLLLKPIPNGLSDMANEFEDLIRKKGFESIATLSGDNIPQQFVGNILQVYDKYNQIAEVFHNDAYFIGALDKALHSVVNQRTGANCSTRAAIERLVRYMDSLLRKSLRGMTDNEFDNKLSRTMIVFRLIEDKDMFQKFYAKLLSARLIHGLSVTIDADELMINKLKDACGYEFTCKMSRMFTDLVLSNELNDGFNQSFNLYCMDQNIECNKTPMQPLVLTAGSWPLSLPSAGVTGTNHTDFIAFSLPYDMKQCADDFETFYMKKHSGRKFSWLHHTSHGELRTNYLDKQYVIQISLFQMAILLAFNVQISYKVADLSASTGLVGELILNLVKSLVDGNMVGCSDKEPTLESTVTLKTNVRNRRIRFKLPTIQSTKHVQKGTECDNYTVAQDRKYYIECAVVRIMKTRKVLKHVELISEVMEQVKGRFKPEVVHIKKCIEALIDKMYIQRTEASDDTNI